MTEQPIHAVIKDKSQPSPELRAYMDISIKRALYASGMSPEDAAKYMREKAPLLNSMTAEDMAERLLLELDNNQFVHC